MADFTYAEVGATRTRDGLPPDAHRIRDRRRLGGLEAFDTAAEFVLAYGMQRAAGFSVSPAGARAVPGLEVTLRAWFGPVRVTAPTRVVYVLEEPDRRGFAYGTLPGHPESGEELFLVERVGDQTWVEVRAFSRPGRWFTRLGGPVVRLLQKRATTAYLDGVGEAVEQVPG